MGTDVLSLRIDGELLERLRQHASKRGMSVQDYVVRTLIRDDFDERFKAAVDETEKFYGGTERSLPPAADHAGQVNPRAGIR
ncbi:hypothetical protein DSC45_27750 [Streptomyces sp. YIM 130001]|uniref:ribbon-helix-helix protein, CopG family n=1 Tax=Streptomyces sp. YIM 130001 TaxID=2259644 RepID=UPI000E65C05B|nr:ribbon-helix-helix protein, CopG family [Streptomyces sp. YIM 130001]RII11709.1 hypothetical protein DSC45_27750 [Streptomyces sp. YIM 130001]